MPKSNASLVSIVVPCRNSRRTLDKCLRAILASDYAGKIEVIVVDNGSQDQTPHIAQNFGVKCVFEPKAGRSHARNRGIREAKAELIAFVDSDCLVSKTWL
jgi:glycosyltransferase involved in cell wall biosynthesis